MKTQDNRLAAEPAREVVCDIRPWLWVFVMILMSCAESIKHDEILAGKRAVEFAQVAFVKQDVEKAYALLADSAKGYVPLEKFKETLSRMHPSLHPTSVTATEYEPMPGEKAIYIYITGETSGEQLQYTLTMLGTAANDYKVSRFNRGNSSYLPSTAEKKKFSKPISAPF
jgi:hypothetical protein